MRRGTKSALLMIAALHSAAPSQNQYKLSHNFVENEGRVARPKRHRVEVIELSSPHEAKPPPIIWIYLEMMETSPQIEC